MTPHPFRVFGLAGLALALATAGPSLAQPSPGGPPGGGPPSAENPAGLAQKLRDELRLRPDQETALRAFVQAVIPPPGAVERLRQAQLTDQTLPTPARLDRMLAHMDEMRAIVSVRVDATKRFYAQLSPDQRRTFDNQPAPGRPGGRGPSAP
ncbi:MAG: Spy/CpxP family protein refolding chaperone [Pseudomonadota bacterium]